jgi:DHA1 family multidrug resistance protein-like MFS transporter
MELWRRNLYILMGSQFLVMGAMTMIIPFLPLYLQEMGVTDPEKNQMWAGVIFGINFLSAFVMAPVWGSLADKKGRKIMVLRSGFGMSVVMILTGLATSPLQLMLLRLLNGTISGFVPASISLVATNTPRERVGYALGMLQSGGVAGSIMGPFIGGALAELIGFRMIFYLTGALLGIASLVVLFFVKEEKLPEEEKSQSAGFFADGSFILHQRTLLILFAAGFLLQFAMLGPQPQMPLYVERLGAPGGYIAFFAGLVTAVTGMANMMASPFLGRLGDRIGSDRVMVYAMIAAALFFIPHAFVTNVWQLLVLRFLLGLCMGGLLPSLHALVRHHAPAGKESTVYGYNSSAIFLGNMMGPIVGGFLTVWIDIRGLFLVTAGLLLFGAWWIKTGLNRPTTPKREQSVPQKRVSSAH